MSSGFYGNHRYDAITNVNVTFSQMTPKISE